MPCRIYHIHPVILTVSIQMQALRFILFPRIGIPCQKPPHFWLVVPCPQIDFLCLLIVVLPAVAERVVVFSVRLYFIAKGVVLIGLDDVSFFVGQLYYIPMRIGYIVLFLGCLFRGVFCSFVSI